MKIALSPLAPALFLGVAACGGQPTESNETAIANQAESLERAANATTDQMIRQIEAEARAEQSRQQSAAPPPAAESSKR